MQVAQRRHPMLRKFICRSTNVARRTSYQFASVQHRGRQNLVAAGFLALRASKVTADENGLLDAVQSRHPVLDSLIPLW
jgi:hypothetical protein